MSASELKERFDSNSNELKDKFNELTDTLASLGVDEVNVLNENTGYTKAQMNNITNIIFGEIDTKANKNDVYTKEYIEQNYYTQDAVVGVTSGLYASKS